MAIKIDTNQSATAYHIVTGAFVFPYAIDAQHAIGAHPLEWSETPWTADAAAAARQQLNERATASGEPPIPDPEPLSAEDQAALDEHNKAVAAAAERLAAYRERKAKEKEEADQIAADEALVATPPPTPDPTIRRPFGRKGEPTAAEIAAAKKLADKKAADEQAAAKAKADQIAAANPTQTSG